MNPNKGSPPPAKGRNPRPIGPPPPPKLYVERSEEIPKHVLQYLELDKNNNEIEKLKKNATQIRQQLKEKLISSSQEPVSPLQEPVQKEEQVANKEAVKQVQQPNEKEEKEEKEEIRKKKVQDERKKLQEKQQNYKKENIKKPSIFKIIKLNLQKSKQ
jgi:hypothetical protein